LFSSLLAISTAWQSHRTPAEKTFYGRGAKTKTGNAATAK
jgi:hypothetical protein